MLSGFCFLVELVLPDTCCFKLFTSTTFELEVGLEVTTGLVVLPARILLQRAGALAMGALGAPAVRLALLEVVWARPLTILVTFGLAALWADCVSAVRPALLEAAGAPLL